MKKASTLTIMVIILTMISGSIGIMANGYGESIIVDLYQNSDANSIPKYKENPDEEGHRAPSRPITCIISPEELQIPGIDTTDIYLFEVHDSDGEPMASFTEMSDFIDYIFGATTTIEIRLHIDGYILCGYIYI